MTKWIILTVICLVALIWVPIKHVSADKKEFNMHIVRCHASELIYKISDCSFGPNTEELDLSNNKIQGICKDDFRGLKNLKKLELQFNQIEMIDDGAFQDLIQLKYLDISNNKLFNLSVLPLSSTLSLKYLDVTNNPYQDIYLGVQFSRLTQLRTLKFGNQNIISLRTNDLQAIHGLVLKHVSVTTGDLQSYESSALKVFNNLETLTLELNIRENVQILPTLLEDASNASRGLQMINVNFTSEGITSTLFSPLINSTLTSLAFQNIFINDVSVISLYDAVFHSIIEELVIDTVKFKSIGSWVTQVSPVYDIKLKKLFIGNIDNPNFYGFYSLEYIVELFIQLAELSLVKTSLFYLPCKISETMVNLVYANFANNLLTEYTVFPDCENPFPSLQKLILNNNKFTDIQSLSYLTYHMKNLSFLSADFNAITVTARLDCKWTKSLNNLVLRYNNLSNNIFDCLPDSLENLDLSHNNITVLYNLDKLKSLKELYLTGNQIISFPSPQMVPSLKVLYIDNNKVSNIDINQFKNFMLIELKAGNNPFICHCETSTLSDLLSNSTTAILDWPDEFICQSPQDVKGKQFSSLYFSLLQCKPGLVIGIIVACVVMAIIIIVLLFIKFNGPWYVRTLCLWLRAKRSNDIDLVQRSLEYHAFISYSEHDSSWVKENLVPQLENNDPPYQVCIHDRDFKPGKTIIANIIDCISKSYKTIFVLSQNFVQSEWCHYEFFFAHHQLFDEKKDSLILLLLEPIPANSIPDRFCKLRKLMNKNTYLEWPHDTGCQSVFWKRLKAILDIEFKPNSMPEHNPEV
ncbi:toll-like receptor 2 [Protopterus annectens]|uniref:toll-like receptor 2 n=1 Tax=Protopterus annectens TaxID=7888 RepID=UPI001CF9B0E9|nr:toll-like receptor 2 [Protopterus annectens]